MKNLIFILILAFSLTTFAQQKKVAVYVTGDDADINKVLGSKLVSAIARSEEYSATERTSTFLAELNKEQSYQHSGFVDDDEISRLGKQFGVQYVCVAAVSKVFNQQYISARLIDVETAQVERTASSSGNVQSLDELIAAANSLSNELLSGLKQERQKNTKKVAVYVVKSEAAKEMGRVLGDKLVAGFTNSGRYIAIERTNSFLSQLSKEHVYQREGAVDEREISRLGKQFGVQYVCVTDVSEVFGEKFISTRMIDVETADVVNTHEVSGKMDDMPSCLKMANEISTNLSKGTLKEQAEEARLKAEEAARKKAAEEARLKAEREERERLLAEQRERQIAQQKALEEERQRRRNDTIAQIDAILQQGYLIVVSGSNKYLVDLTIHPEQSFKDANYTYSAYGFKGWRLPTRDEVSDIWFGNSSMSFSKFLFWVYKYKDKYFLTKSKSKYWCYYKDEKERWYYTIEYSSGGHYTKGSRIDENDLVKGGLGGLVSTHIKNNVVARSIYIIKF